MDHELLIQKELVIEILETLSLSPLWFHHLVLRLKMANSAYIFLGSLVFSVFMFILSSCLFLELLTLFILLSCLLVLQGHCYPSNKQQTFLVMVAPERERACMCVQTQPARFPLAWCVEAGNDGEAYYVCLGDVNENVCRRSCSLLGKNVKYVKWKITLITLAESLKKAVGFGKSETETQYLYTRVYTSTRTNLCVHICIF